MVRWKEYIDWERSNPQSLDGPALTARISLAYDQSLMYLLHYPEVMPRPTIETGSISNRLAKRMLKCHRIPSCVPVALHRLVRSGRAKTVGENLVAGSVLYHELPLAQRRRMEGAPRPMMSISLCPS